MPSTSAYPSRSTPAGLAAFVRRLTLLACLVLAASVPTTFGAASAATPSNVLAAPGPAPVRPATTAHGLAALPQADTRLVAAATPDAALPLLPLAIALLLATVLAAVLALQCRRLARRLRQQAQQREALEKKLLASTARLERLGDTDLLTGLSNRLKFETLARQEIARSERYAQPLALALLDIDRFKKINDNHGHQVGDGVLCSIARLLRNNLRQSDQLCRWSGEAFVILMPHTDLVHASTLAEKLRGLVAGNRFLVDSKITASLGVACLQPGKALDDLLSDADVALYQAKRQGRNRVECAKP
ncbi:MAG: GGDEF domain-containing protein [Pseudomonas sp.]|uniref:GGDEF domain-containing protein n=1 Tax=Pseudomonas sp. TaxID=306 RepID=UPI00339AEFA1